MAVFDDVIGTRELVVKPLIWFFEESRQWWMEPDDFEEAWAVLSQDCSGINVTNAYQVLPPQFIESLKDRQFHRLTVGRIELTPKNFRY